MSTGYPDCDQPLRLDWLPVAALLLAGDGRAEAVNAAWVDLAGLPAEGSHGDGWLAAVAPERRQALRDRLRLAAATGDPGTADCLLTGARSGHRTRWWWRGAPRGTGLLVCVARLDGQQQALPDIDGLVDLTSVVIQRISEAGLVLAAALSVTSGPAAPRLQHALDLLDRLIQDIRSNVFGLLTLSGESGAG